MDTIKFENLLIVWSYLKYPELSVLLSYLKYISTVHQTHHWAATGTSFYSDHQLFQRLYEVTNKEIDLLAEKAVGLDSATSVNITRQTKQLVSLCASYGSSITVPGAELISRSLSIEIEFVDALSYAMVCLDETKRMTPGLENLLSGIADAHEGNIYLLKRVLQK